MSEFAKKQFAAWQAERDQFELSWRSNESLLLAPIPADPDALKEFAWHVWQHAVSSAKRGPHEMPNHDVNVKIAKLQPGQVTMTLKVDVRELRVRMAIGLWLIRLGARVIGLGVKVEPLETPA